MRKSLLSFFPSRRAGLLAGLAVAATLTGVPALIAQDAATQDAATQQTTDGAAQPTTTAAPQQNAAQAPAAQTPAAQTPAAQTAPTDATLSNTTSKKTKPAKSERVQQSKDTRNLVKHEKKLEPIAGKDQQLPDKQLYDKALVQEQSGHFDVARLDLETLLNTYPDSQYQMRAKLAVADCWYKEGGTAALTQAEQEYGDFITFFPNAPEAAEAQMRIGDIYFKQLDVPDRDYSKAEHAEDAYRTMMKQYPDAPKEITAQAKQKLREVQELLASREAELAAFYATRANWPATIARYKTVIDTYPQYSHMDDALIGLGDAYAAESLVVRQQKLPEAARAKLLEEFDGQAAAAYRKVVLEHAAAPHVEDAKERLAAMDLPIPTPTPEQVASSEALEGSRAQYDLRRRLELLVLRKPDTVTAAQMGDPPLDDATPTYAPAVVKGLQADYVAALSPNAAAKRPAPAPASGSGDAAAPLAAPAAAPEAPASTAAPTLSDVPTAGNGAVDTSTNTMTESAPSNAGAPVGGGGASLGVEVLTPGSTPAATGTPTSGLPAATGAPARDVPAATGTPASSLPAATGAPDPNNGLSAVAPKDATPLPPVEKPAEAPDQINEVEGKPQPAAEAQTTKSGKNKKAPKVDKNDESSSKKKPKKGLDKLNPF